MILNLSNQFNPLKASQAALIQYELMTFSGGEPHVKIKSTDLQDQHVIITTRLTSFNEVGSLLVTVDALKRMGIQSFDLLIPYFPAARQDRVMVPGEALSVKVYAELINQLGANKVTVYDPHSEVTAAVLDHCKVIDNASFIKKCIQKIDQEVILIAPDGGALKKIFKLAQYLGGIPVIQCTKKRNVQTGALSGFEVHADDLKGKHCLIVDDICDGGGTFIGLGEKLKEKNAASIYLAVSHGIFSRGIESLTALFDHTFATDAFRNIDNTDQFTQIKLADGLLS